MKKLIKEHLIQTWIVASIVFAILIHILFVTDAPCDKLQAQWGAGDILTYTSTVALGLLAVWQNQKFKEENDRAQERLEKLTQQANELAIIGKIIDNRSAKLQRLQTCFFEFEIASSPGTIESAYTRAADMSERGSLLSECSRDLTIKVENLIIEISGNKGIPSQKICDAIIRLSDATEEIIDHYFSGTSDSLGEKELAEYIAAHQEFIKYRSIYISRTERVLNKISYEDVSLADIRDFINSTSKKQEDSPNEQQTSPSDPQPDIPEH